jgi:hypothetical protein
MGICHQMLMDYGLVRPGQFVVGTDSHTLVYGALNCVSSGIATDEAAYALLSASCSSPSRSRSSRAKGKARPTLRQGHILTWPAVQQHLCQGSRWSFTPLASDLTFRSGCASPTTATR